MTLTANRIVICPVCKIEIKVRSPFAYQTLTQHLKKHRGKK